MSDDFPVAALQFADSFLPAGSFTTSYGVEQFVAAEEIEDATDLQTLVETYLDRQIGPCDMVVVAAAHGAASVGDHDELRRIDRRCSAVQLPAEFRESSTRTGGQLCSLVADTEDDPFLSAYGRTVESGDAPGNYAAVLGAVAARTGMTARQAAMVQGYSFVTDLVAAAQRVLRIGHTEVQRIVTESRPAIVTAWEANADRTVDELSPFAPLIDVLSAEHERAERRLFLS
ncbi:urease accessory protein [Halorientalis persicus]|jgi:urease accessory protein|uniref:Urease accessory protein n=1 Tax=Halorientalis persicus TaxID=1367881 RepID=A0A1H8CNZ4_9EURY|nr:urease accessory UreF family protein [Halorientalis persicus]SEM96629.1 urease accessory protein [Halorientalis persicus]